MNLGNPDLFSYPRGVHPFGVVERRKQRALMDRWLAASTAHGYFELGLPCLAYAKTFATGHSATGDRVYQFLDRSGRELTLVSDGFIAWVQAVCSTGNPELLEHRVSFLCPIHRYRKPRRRAFHQIGLGYLRLGAERLRATELAEPLRVVDQFAGACSTKLVVQLSHPGMWRAVFDTLGASPRRPLGQLDEEGFFEELTRLPEVGERLAKIARTGRAEPVGVRNVDRAVNNGFAELAALETEIRQHCQNLVITTRLSDLHASEFHDGVAFQVFTDTGFRLGDGGDYSALASKLLGRPVACVSVGFGFERVATELDLPDSSHRLMLATLGTGPTEQMEWLATDLRAAGWDVVPYHAGDSITKVKRAAQALRIDDVVVIGPREIRDGKVSCHDLRLATPPVQVEPNGLSAMLKRGQQ